MNLQHYITEQQVTHEFRIKIARKPTDAQIDLLELHLRKYDAFDITPVSKTIIRPNPADFRSIKAAEIYFIDFKTHYAVSPYMLLLELVQKLDIAERFIVIRNVKDPLHDINSPAPDKDKKYTVMLTDPDYTEAEKIDSNDYYGQKFIDKFLKNEKKLSEDRSEAATAAYAKLLWEDICNTLKLDEATARDIAMSIATGRL